MGVSLFTSRVILQTLGIEDYGIYNLVGGVVVLFSFLNNAMTNATQRFLNVEIAKNIRESVARIFSMSLNIHIFISIIVLILSETLGLWFLNFKLNIPDNRVYAANIVYQMSVITTIIDIMRIPYNATILANERMSFYAFLGIGETIMKLLIVYMLVWFINIDHLIVYAILLMIVNLIVNIVFRIYCRQNFSIETKYKFIQDKLLFRELVAFSGWSLFGQVAVLSSTQGLNMILNIFIGVTVNAAMGISNQINGAIYNFISNIQVAFNPQIIKTYAESNYDRHRSLVLNASKYTTYLFLVLALPLLIYTEFILKLWLGVLLPDYVVSFTQIIIIGSIINALVGPFWMSANAIGGIRNYQLIISAILLFNLPIAYFLLKAGYSPVFVMSTKVILNFITLIFRFIYVNNKLNFKREELVRYCKQISLPILYLLLIMCLSRYFVTNKIVIIVGVIFLSEIVMLIILLLGLSKKEIHTVKQFVKKRNKKKVKNDYKN